MSQQENKYPPIIVRLTNRTQTRWVLEGTENTPNPIYRETPSLYRIIPESQVMIDVLYKKDEKNNIITENGRPVIETYRLKTIRHIAGCESIDPAEQDKMGRTFDAAKDSIWIPEGTTTFRREGNNIGTYDYIRQYQGNISNPMQPPEAEGEFEEVVAIEIAIEKNIDFERKRRAMNIVAAVRKENDGSGMPSYDYDVKKLGSLVRLFEELKGLDTPDEQFMVLCGIAETDPDRIINSVADSRNEVLLLVKQAIEAQVLVNAEDKVYFTEDNAVILPFDRPLNPDTRLNKLVALLQEEEGSVYLKQLQIKVQAKAKNSLAPA